MVISPDGEREDVTGKGNTERFYKENHPSLNRIINVILFVTVFI